MRLSAARPNFRISQPMPPPRVRPATPVWEIRPPVLASPCACVAASKSAHVAPACTRAVRASGSTTTSRIRERSSMIPSSHELRPARLCPPLRIASGSPLSRANPTTETTSSVVRHRAMTAGRLSNHPFHRARASSYPSSPATSATPPNPALNDCNPAFPTATIGYLLHETTGASSSPRSSCAMSWRHTSSSIRRFLRSSTGWPFEISVRSRSRAGKHIAA